jgi:regulator of protease activity HflC (stomatin/prohibitin superfamily)
VRILILVVLGSGLLGCATVDPGHRGLLFERSGLQHDPLLPGTHWIGLTSRVEDFDVTYSTKTEDIKTTSSEGLSLDLRISLIYKPVVSELYELDTEVGTNYYDEVIAPELRSAARGVFAHHSYLELLRKNEQIEDEIEADVRRRTAGKHVEIASVTMESLQYAPEIGKAVEEKLAAEQDAARQKTLLENQAMQARMRAETALREKEQETELAKQQAELDRVKEQAAAEQGIIRAKAEAEESKLVAQAKAAEAKAINQSLTPLAVMLKGYEALQALGGSNTHILLGDWSHVPAFLFPPLSAFKGAAAQAEAGKP